MDVFQSSSSDLKHHCFLITQASDWKVGNVVWMEVFLRESIFTHLVPLWCICLGEVTESSGVNALLKKVSHFGWALRI